MNVSSFGARRTERVYCIIRIYIECENYKLHWWATSWKETYYTWLINTAESTFIYSIPVKISRDLATNQQGSRAIIWLKVEHVKTARTFWRFNFTALSDWAEIYIYLLLETFVRLFCHLINFLYTPLRHPPSPINKDWKGGTEIVVAEIKWIHNFLIKKYILHALWRLGRVGWVVSPVDYLKNLIWFFFSSKFMLKN